jgi:hypothetical protein
MKTTTMLLTSLLLLWVGMCMIVSHLETAHDIWLKLCNTYEGSSEIKSSRKDTYNRQYQTFA